MSLENIYKNKKVLITGHTGFKGTWLCLWLIQLGAKVSGISLEIPSNPSHFNSANLHDKIEDYRLDIRDSDGLNSLIHKIKPDYVFHLAAQSLVSDSYKNPVNTFQTNLIGSVNLMEATRFCSKTKSFVMITSDKCYQNKEIKRGRTKGK